jgi:hypothetical protein
MPAFLSTVFSSPYFSSVILNIKCSPEVHMLNTWPVTDGAIWGDCGHFSKPGLAGGIRSLGHGFEGDI